MFRPASRSVLRATQSSLSPARTFAQRRFISTEPPHLRSRSWKSSALRWGIAIAGIYYYNTSPVFAEQPQHNLLNPNVDALDDSQDGPSLDVLASRRSRKAETNAQILHSAAATASEKAAESVAVEPLGPADTASPGAAALEEEAEGEGAFNPETGEINWDCPCLGGMAHGPCGPQFREAFSCFVYSNEEPKGMDCIEKFQSMRDCFSEHPDVYKDELMEDEEIDRELEAERAELTQQIAERQKADEASGRRLLEEAPAEPRTPKPPKKTKNKPSTNENNSQTVPASAEDTPASSLSDNDMLPKAAYSAVDDDNQKSPKQARS